MRCPTRSPQPKPKPSQQGALKENPDGPKTFWIFLLVRFWAFLGKGSSKTPYKYFCKKSMSKTFSEKIDKFFDISFSSIFWVYRVFGCFSAMGVRKHYKKRFTKKSCRKVLQKDDKNTPNRIFSVLFYHVYGHFSVR
jgi:hypothetical protein